MRPDMPEDFGGHSRLSPNGPSQQRPPAIRRMSDAVSGRIVE